MNVRDAVNREQFTLSTAIPLKTNKNKKLNYILNLNAFTQRIPFKNLFTPLTMKDNIQVLHCKKNNTFFVKLELKKNFL